MSDVEKPALRRKRDIKKNKARYKTPEVKINQELENIRTGIKRAT
jgi:hypothetical protein